MRRLASGDLEIIETVVSSFEISALGDVSKTLTEVSNSSAWEEFNKVLQIDEENAIIFIRVF